MEVLKTIDVYTAVDRMLVKTARMDLCAVYYNNRFYHVHATNEPAYFANFPDLGNLICSVVFGKIQYGELDGTTRKEIKDRIERHNIKARQN